MPPIPYLVSHYIYILQAFPIFYALSYTLDTLNTAYSDEMDISGFLYHFSSFTWWKIEHNP